MIFLCVDSCDDVIVFLFYSKGKWIIGPGKAGKIKVVLVLLQIESSLSKKIIQLASIHAKWNILTSIFTLYFIF